MMKETHKLIYSILFLMVIFYFVGIYSVWAHQQAIKNKNIYPLKDLGFLALEDLYSKHLAGMNDYLLYAVIFITLLWTIIFSKQKVIILKRWIIMLSVLFLRLLTDTCNAGCKMSGAISESGYNTNPRVCINGCGTVMSGLFSITSPYSRRSMSIFRGSHFTCRERPISSSISRQSFRSSSA